MRITFLSPPPNRSGGIRIVADYARILQDRGHEVLVVYPPSKPLNLRERARRLIRGGGPAVVAGEMTSHYDDFAIVQKCLERARPVAPDDVPDSDVVVATWWETAEWLHRFPASKGAQAYFLQHYEIHAHLPADRVRRTWSFPMHKIVVCQWLADVARDEYGDSDVSVVPNTVNTEHFTAPPRGKQPVPTVGLMYAAAEFKGYRIARDAIEIARRDIPDLKVIAFSMRPAVDGLPLPENTEHHVDPAQADLPGLYASCDAWLFASLSEGFGLPILEAMACRTPVIGTPAGAAPELLRDGAGLMVPKGDAQAMAEAILEVAGYSEAEWKGMSDAGYERVASYSWDEATDLFEAALLRAVEKSG